MHRFASLLLKIWSTACRHVEIYESTARIAPLLQRRLPVALMVVRRIDMEHSYLETVGCGGTRSAGHPEETRSTLTAMEMEQLLVWCRRGDVLHLPCDACPIAVEHVVPLHHADEVLAGPLLSSAGALGVFLLMARRGESFDEVHEELAAALCEPLSVALDNDRERRAIETRHEAAEADRHSLLTKLGRQDISGTIVGAESGLRSVMERVDLVSESDVPVLLFGETGSGKEVVARAVHTRSGRAKGPFLRVNCGAIPPDLIDSELFGHERGSFTGAVAMRKGWFERADRGTLFLDEVGELPLAAQVRLLRILQDGTLERVGGQRQLTVDVRVVAATNRDLQAMVADGKFRDDLWYRLAVFPIQLPALRDRPEDMPALATHFALRAARRFGLPNLVPTPDDVNLMLAYDWPGNIRELAAVIDRAAILGNGRRLEIATALGALNAARPGAANGPRPPANHAQTSTDIAPLDTVIAEHIQAALRKTSGRVEGPNGTAALLRINPHTLRARMRKLKIDWTRFRN